MAAKRECQVRSRLLVAYYSSPTGFRERLPSSHPGENGPEPQRLGSQPYDCTMNRQAGSLAVLRPRMRPTPRTKSPTASTTPAT